MTLRPVGRAVGTATQETGETVDGFEISACMGRQDLEELSLQVRWLAKRYGFKVTEFRLEPAGDHVSRDGASETAARVRSRSGRQEK